MFRKGKIMKGPAGFKIMTGKFVVNAQIDYSTLFDDNFGSLQLYTIIPGFIVYYDRKYVTLWRCPIPP